MARQASKPDLQRIANALGMRWHVRDTSEVLAAGLLTRARQVHADALACRAQLRDAERIAAELGLVGPGSAAARLAAEVQRLRKSGA